MDTLSTNEAACSPFQRAAPRKFTDDQIRYIRRRFREVGAYTIAREMGVSAPTIYNIVLRKTYKDVSDEE